MTPPKKKHGVFWQDGDDRIQRTVDRWAKDPGTAPSTRLHHSRRRTLVRLAAPQELSLGNGGEATARALMLKIHHTRTGAHPRRERLKGRIGWSPALREWNALVELQSLGVPVPTPLAWGRLANRDPIVVTEYCYGRNLGAVLDTASVHARQDWIDRLADAIVVFHRTGFRHGDLHLSNLHVQGDRILIMDLQSARRARHRREQLRDLAHIDLALARAGFGINLRIQLRDRIGTHSGRDRAARAFVADFIRGRTRKDLRGGGAWMPWQVNRCTGFHDRAFSVEQLRNVLERALDDPAPQMRQSGRVQISPLPAKITDTHDSVIVKRMRVSSPSRAARERVTGSKAQRAFRAGQQLSLLGRISARPLAFLEDRSGFGPYSNWLFLEKVGQQDLDAFQPGSEEEAQRCAKALVQWVAEWQAWGIEHRDLKASNIRIEVTKEEVRFWLIDLEDVRLTGHALSDRSRFRSLVQLGASLPDNAFSLEARRLALSAYLERLPFARSNSPSWRAALVRASLARQHRWKGVGCSLAAADEETGQSAKKLPG